MKRTLVLLCALSALIGSSAAAGSVGDAAMLCVNPGKAGCFATIQGAVNAAASGDTIKVAAGTFAGGITIPKSVHLVGAGAHATIIRGGGPVLTIGDPTRTTTPMVTIHGVTITGGVTHSGPQGETAIALGGGIWIPAPGKGDAPGAIVTISQSVITHNRTSPLSTLTGVCGPRPFRFCSFAAGGGIDNGGTLTLLSTKVTNNVAGAIAGDPSAATDASGGGIDNEPGATLTLKHSVVSGNSAAVAAPNGQFSDGGGITSHGVLTIEDSVVSGNTSMVTASVPSSFPVDVQEEANAGGIYLTEQSSTTIERSQVSGNRVTSSNTAGDVEAESGGIDSDGSLTLVDSSVDHNSATGSVPASSGFLTEADGGGLQVQGVTTLRSSHIVDNSVSATSLTGVAVGSGGGVLNLSGKLTLEQTVVSTNSAASTGVGGVNLGGGIDNIQFGGPAPVLSLTDSVVTANRLTASAGVPSLGGGIFNLEITNVNPFTTGSPFPVALTRTVIAGNQPDQCAGC
jgi:hypothetical protein